jgi:hypothetical protein
MVTVAQCSDLTHAFRLKMLLACSGIDSFIPDENSATIAPHYFFASGVRLQVAEKDLRRARKIVASPEQTREDPPS